MLSLRSRRESGRCHRRRMPAAFDCRVLPRGESIFLVTRANNVRFRGINWQVLLNQIEEGHSETERCGDCDLLLPSCFTHDSSTEVSGKKINGSFRPGPAVGGGFESETGPFVRWTYAQAESSGEQARKGVRKGRMSSTIFDVRIAGYVFLGG